MKRLLILYTLHVMGAGQGPRSGGCEGHVPQNEKGSTNHTLFISTEQD